MTTTRLVECRQKLSPIAKATLRWCKRVVRLDPGLRPTLRAAASCNVVPRRQRLRLSCSSAMLDTEHLAHDKIYSPTVRVKA